VSAHLGDGVASLLADHPDAAERGPWIVVDYAVGPELVMTAGGLWELYPSAAPLLFDDADAALDTALEMHADVIRHVGLR